MKSLTTVFKKLSFFKLLVLLSFILISSNAKAQIPVEVLAGDEQLQHQFFFFKDLDKKQKVNLFSMARFTADYEEDVFNSSLISSQFTYNLTSNWGISAGGIHANGIFNPIAAVSYSYFNPRGDLFMNLFPTVVFNDEIEYELSGIFLYTPKLSERYSLFSQIIFATTVDHQFEEHLFSYQQFRLRIGYKDYFQVGIGLDQTFIGSDFMELRNIGIFIRKEL